MACNGCAGQSGFEDSAQPSVHFSQREQDDDESSARLLGDAEAGTESREPPNVNSNLRLLDESLEEIGTGMYQLRVFILAALSIFVDISELALTSLLYVEFQKEWGVKEEELAVVGSMSAAGLTLGSISAGWISDRFGRIFAFGPTLLICVVFGVLSSISNSVPAFAVCRFFVGIAAGGNVVICNSILLESVPSSKRGQYVVMTGVAFGLAHLVMVGLAWLLFPSIGWRWVIRITLIFFIPMAFLFRKMVESPRYYVQKGLFEKAVTSLEKIARMNRTKVPAYFSIENLQRGAPKDPSEEGGGDQVRERMCRDSRKLVTRRNLQVLFPLALVWFFQAFAGGIFQFLPLELRHKIPGHSVHYIVAVTMAVAGICGTLINISMTSRFSRRYVLRVSSFLSAASTFTLILAHHSIFLFVGVFLMHVASCITTGTLFLYTPEVFATSVRATAFGLCLVFFRIAHIVSPFLVAALASSRLMYSSLVFGSIYLVAAMCTWCLVPEPEGFQLYEEDDEVAKVKGFMDGQGDGQEHPAAETFDPQLVQDALRTGKKTYLGGDAVKEPEVDFEI